MANFVHNIFFNDMQSGVLFPTWHKHCHRPSEREPSNKKDENKKASSLIKSLTRAKANQSRLIMKNFESSDQSKKS